MSNYWLDVAELEVVEKERNLWCRLAGCKNVKGLCNSTENEPSTYFGTWEEYQTRLMEATTPVVEHQEVEEHHHHGTFNSLRIIEVGYLNTRDLMRQAWSAMQPSFDEEPLPETGDLTSGNYRSVAERVYMLNLLKNKIEKVIDDKGFFPGSQIYAETLKEAGA